MSHDLLKLRIHMNTPDVQSAETLWDELVRWCAGAMRASSSSAAGQKAP